MKYLKRINENKIDEIPFTFYEDTDEHGFGIFDEWGGDKNNLDIETGPVLLYETNEYKIFTYYFDFDKRNYLMVTDNNYDIVLLSKKMEQLTLNFIDSRLEFSKYFKPEEEIFKILKVFNKKTLSVIKNTKEYKKYLIGKKTKDFNL